MALDNRVHPTDIHLAGGLTNPCGYGSPEVDLRVKNRGFAGIFLYLRDEFEHQSEH
jgi:hypothetical protein